MSMRFRSSRSGAAAAAVLATLLVVPAASVAQQTPQFRTTVDVVQVQIAVADSRGNHLPDLSIDDIILRVDGRVRELTTLYEVDLRQINPVEEQDDSYVPAAGWRQFLLFFDFSFSTKPGILRAQEAARNFVIAQSHPRDLIGVASYSQVSGLQLISPFTADRRQVLDALNTFGLAQAGKTLDPAGLLVQNIDDLYQLELQNVGVDTDQDGNIDNRTDQQQAVLDELFAVSFSTQAGDFRRYREQVINYADQLVALGPLLQATNGRKHVLLFSAGFSDEVLTGQTLDELAEDTQRIDAQGALGMAAVNSETRFGSIDLRNTLQEAVQNFQHADVVFHAFDTSGLDNEARDDTFATRTSGKQALSYIADGTDGTVHWNANDLAPNLADLAEQTSRYYVVAYPKRPDDPPVVELDFAIQRPGAQVVAAPRRFAPPPAYADMDEFQKQLQLAEFIAKGIEEEDMTFDVRAVPFAGMKAVSRVAVVLEVPFHQLRRIADARGDGMVELDVLGYVLDDRDEIRDLFSRRVRLDLERIAQRLDGLPFRYYDLMWSLPGSHKVRVLVRDAQVGMISTRTVPVEIPAFAQPNGVLVSGPVAVDAAHPGLILRGIDAANPPEHRVGGPVSYPFTLAGRDITPQVYTVTPPGGAFQFMMVSYNAARHPFTGEPQTTLDARVIDEMGNSHDLDGLTLVGRHYDPETDGTTVVVEVQLNGSLQPGAYLVEIDLVDAVGGETVQQVMPLLIQMETGG